MLVNQINVQHCYQDPLLIEQPTQEFNKRISIQKILVPRK